MSDPSDDDIEEGEDEDEEDEDEEEEDEGEDEEEEGEIDKAQLAKDDIDIIKEIFCYIDQTNRRLSDRLKIEKDVKLRNAHIQRREQLDQVDNTDLSWAQYENLDEVQRAELLEKAIMVLSHPS